MALTRPGPRPERTATTTAGPRTGERATARPGAEQLFRALRPAFGRDLALGHAQGTSALSAAPHPDRLAPLLGPAALIAATGGCLRTATRIVEGLGRHESGASQWRPVLAAVFADLLACESLTTVALRAAGLPGPGGAEGPDGGAGGGGPLVAVAGYVVPLLVGDLLGDLELVLNECGSDAGSTERRTLAKVAADRAVARVDWAAAAACQAELVRGLARSADTSGHREHPGLRALFRLGPEAAPGAGGRGDGGPDGTGGSAGTDGAYRTDSADCTDGPDGADRTDGPYGTVGRDDCLGAVAATLTGATARLAHVGMYRDMGAGTGTGGGGGVVVGSGTDTGGDGTGTSVGVGVGVAARVGTGTGTAAGVGGGDPSAGALTRLGRRLATEQRELSTVCRRWAGPYDPADPAARALADRQALLLLAASVLGVREAAAEDGVPFLGRPDWALLALSRIAGRLGAPLPGGTPDAHPGVWTELAVRGAHGVDCDLRATKLPW